MVAPRGCGFREVLEREIGGELRPLSVAVEAYGTALQLSLVAGGAGFGIMPERLLARSRERGQLDVLDGLGLGLEVVVWMVRRPRLGSLEPALDVLYHALARLLENGVEGKAHMRPAAGNSVKRRSHRAALAGSGREPRASRS